LAIGTKQEIGFSAHIQNVIQTGADAIQNAEHALDE
jgi:hypothetical protein